jgi:hypothetical protein
LLSTAPATGTTAAVVMGTAGNDVLAAGPGNAILVGDGGYDSYQIAAGFGRVAVNNAASDGVTGASGEVDFGAGISTDQLWFQQRGNDLQIDLLGTHDTVTLAGWYGGDARAQVQSFDTADGARLDSQLAQLVSAMATYSSNSPGFDPTTATQMPTDSGLQGALAAAWHH